MNLRAACKLCLSCSVTNNLVNSTLPLTNEYLSQVSFTSNVTNYVRQDQQFERRALGLTSHPGNTAQYLQTWDKRWAKSSSNTGK